MSNQRLSAFEGEKYLNLESYKRNGQPVATPLWFADQDGTIYVYTMEDAFKVKRIRNNPKVRIAPCDIRGRLKGDWVEGRASIVTGDQERRGNELLDRKYWGKRIGNFISRFRKRKRVMITIEVD
jgi:PPOX class probable F420-dependent enzyme